MNYITATDPKKQSFVKRAFALGMLGCSLLSTQFAGAAGTDTRQASISPKEVYGSQGVPIELNLGNGGAGPTGVLKALANDYLSLSQHRFAIAWYQDISPNTLRQLQAGKIDIALVYERRQEQAALAAGYATHDTLVFNDHFLLAGPRDNPAHLRPSDTPAEAMKKIALLGERTKNQVFLSRDDHSATNEKERSIWRAAGLTPWTTAVWYRKNHVFPKPALLNADASHLYTLSDHGTWLSTRAKLHTSRIFIMGGDLLRNPCHALLASHPRPVALDFLRYLTSVRGQNVLANFGRARYQGEAFFTNAHRLDF